MSMISTQDGSLPDVTTLSDGSFVVSWAVSDGSGPTGQLYVQHCNPDGSAIAGPLLVSADFEFGLPIVIALPGGGYQVAARVAGDDQDGHYFRGYVWFTYDSLDNPIGGPDYVGEGSWSYGSDGFINANGYTLSVSHTENVGWDAKLYVIDSAGSNVFSGNLATDDTGTQFAPELISLGDGSDILTVWSDNSGQLDTDGFGVYGRIFSTQTMNFVTAPFLLNVDTTGDEVGTGGQSFSGYEADTYALTAFKDGSFSVFWYDSSSGDIQGRFFYGAGADQPFSARGGEFTVNATTAGTQHFVDSTLLPTGDVFAVYSSVSEDGTTTSVFGKEFTSDGSVARNEFLIATIDDPDCRPRVTAVSRSDVVVTWAEDITVDHPEGETTVVETVSLLDHALIQHGTNHADRLIGQAGVDWIFGHGGNDVIKGRAGDDALWGGRGDDRLNGGSGKDILAGGHGCDVFVFANLSNSLPGREHDIIWDFAEGRDRIDLSRIDAIAGGDDDPFTLVPGEPSARPPVNFALCISPE